MMMLTWSCSSGRSGRVRASGKWPVEVLCTGDWLALLEIGKMNSSVAAWSGPARMKHVGMAFVQLLEAERKIK